MGLSLWYRYFFKTHFQSVKFKGLLACDNVSNLERTSYQSYRNFSQTFYQRNLWLSFLDWEPKCGDIIHHKVLSSTTGLESPKSLVSDRASFWIRFCWSAKLRLNTSSLHVTCKVKMHTNVFTEIMEHIEPKVFKLGCR